MRAYLLAVMSSQQMNSYEFSYLPALSCVSCKAVASVRDPVGRSGLAETRKDMCGQK
jgi:hypothetical protein